MTRFVVDPSTVLALLSEGSTVAPEHQLLAPTLFRSQVLSALHSAVHHGTLDADVARARLTAIRAMPIRLLGDGVMQRRAWEIADRLGWASTLTAEYLALTQLQADAFVTMDLELASRVAGLVPLGTIDQLTWFAG